jgi:hypothetical protein
MDIGDEIAGRNHITQSRHPNAGARAFIISVHERASSAQSPAIADVTFDHALASASAPTPARLPACLRLPACVRAPAPREAAVKLVAGNDSSTEGLCARSRA